MRTLFDSLYETAPRSSWVPEAPPCLDGVQEIELDTETDGLRWWEDNRPIGFALYYGDRTQYIPFAHRGGGNLDEATVKRWAERELRGKHIVNLNTKFDLHMARVWGIDLEAQGNTVSDVGHYAALLDDHRKQFSLEAISQDYLGVGKQTGLDKTRMADYHAGDVAAYAEQDVRLVRQLKELLLPRLQAEDLMRVKELEDQVIYVTAEMEKNGAPINVELLERWIMESQTQLNRMLWEIAREVGFQVNPDSPKDQERVFQKYKIPVERTTTGRPSFTDAVLKTVEHPVVQLMRRAGRLMSLRSKFLLNTKTMMSAGGILRYSLHQLRAAKDDHADSGEAGTVTGRYSSTALIAGEVGVNIQQRMKAARQRISFGFDEDDESHDDEIFLLRKLHIAGSGQLLSSDMDQAQYRIFASYANNPRIIAAYKENPNLSFHKFMHGLIAPYAELSYRGMKDTNFAYLFGAGLTKMALMLGHITAAEFDEIRRFKDFNNHKLSLTKEVQNIYNREVPEVKDLLARAAHLAKPECDERCNRHDLLHRTSEHRGYVKDAIGRRMRFPDGNRLHKAFNGVDQMTEASYMKTKMVELHKVRHQTGFLMRITNHDELVGDIQSLEGARLVDDVLNHQSFPQLRVPLTWSTEVGRNWAETENLESAFKGLMETRATIGYPNTGHNR